MKNYAFREVKEKYTPELLAWYEAFQQADRMKKLAFSIAGYSMDQNIIDKMDRRMKKAWDKVKELEPFPTFVNDDLCDKARYYLNGIMIFKLTKQL